MEDFSKIHEEEFDYITARAVSQLPILCEISVKALKVNGSLVFMKANCDEELLGITELICKNKNVSDITGIDKMSNLVNMIPN